MANYHTNDLAIAADTENMKKGAPELCGEPCGEFGRDGA